MEKTVPDESALNHGTVIVGQPRAQPVVTPLVDPLVITRNSQMKNSNAIMGLGITQIVIGSLIIALGIIIIALYGIHYWSNNNIEITVTGLGLLILITGILGICASRNPLNVCVNGSHMAFNIIASISVCCYGIGFVNALVILEDFGGSRINTFKVLCGCFVVLMAIEFFVALATSILCCQRGCCRSTQGVIVQAYHPQPQMIVSHTQMTGSYFQPVPHYQPQYMMSPQEPPANPHQQPQGAQQQQQVEHQGMGMYPQGVMKSTVTYPQYPSDEQMRNESPPAYNANVNHA